MADVDIYLSTRWPRLFSTGHSIFSPLWGYHVFAPHSSSYSPVRKTQLAFAPFVLAKGSYSIAYKVVWIRSMKTLYITVRILMSIAVAIAAQKKDLIIDTDLFSDVE